MTFNDPYLLLLLLALPVLLLLRRRTGESATPGRFSSVALLSAFRPTWRLRYRWLPTAVRAAALALLVIAIARPQTGQADSILPGQGIDIALVLDLSSSMQSASLGTGSRQEVAQRVLTNFIEGREEDRIGLVIFREENLVLSPLTLDYEALVQSLAAAPQVGLSDGTAIGDGLASSLDLLRESRARSRIAILLTDGENTAGSVEPLAAARIAETLGIRVYTIGVLAPGSGGSGSANVNETALREIANVTGGQYYPAESEQALTAIYQSIEELEKSRVGRPQYGQYNELAPYFLAVALLLLAVELGLRATVWRQAT
ncbi:MAG TPA: VWA domain-containing protein [Dehalococcoidia bacterium]|nr:VWA domain-containing protein [Dehalococcoidia bacterium]